MKSQWTIFRAISPRFVKGTDSINLAASLIGSSHNPICYAADGHGRFPFQSCRCRRAWMGSYTPRNSLRLVVPVSRYRRSRLGITPSKALFQ